MKKLSKNQKISLSILFGFLGLMCFHPAGRIIVKLILPLGLGIMDLLGTAFLLLCLFFIFLPQISTKWRRRKLNKRTKKSKDSTTISNQITQFIFRLVQCDKNNEYVPYFMKVIDIGTTKNNQFLVERFVNYYGELTIKFLNSQDKLHNYNSSEEIQDTIYNISLALKDIQRICDNFIFKLLDDDVLDLDLDITVLNRIAVSDKLKGE